MDECPKYEYAHTKYMAGGKIPAGILASKFVVSSSGEARALAPHALAFALSNLEVQTCMYVHVNGHLVVATDADCLAAV